MIHSKDKLSEGEAAAFYCDVGVQILTAVTKTEAACDGTFGGFAGIRKMNAGTVFTFEVLQV